MSFSLFEGPDIQGAVRIGHSRMVVWDAAYLFSLASFVRDVALLLPVSDSIAEQILIDACAIACQVSVPLAPLTPLMVLFGAMFPPVCKVVEAGVKHGPWDI
jgi:hypothetical protein